MVAAFVFSASISSMVALTSSPTPKVNIRVLGLILAITSRVIFSGLVSPIVGIPSVKKTITNGLDASLPRISSAASKASRIAVPPVESNPSIHFLPVFLNSSFAGTNSSRNRLTAVAKLSIEKRSFSPRLLMQYLRAFLACSIFGPRILPEVSITKTKSRGIGFTLFPFIEGLIINEKYPSSVATGR